MPWPDKKHIEKQREEFFKNGGAKFVQERILGVPSIGKHKKTGEPWPAFHRCHICGQHPEVMGDRAVKHGDYLNLHYCEYCVTQMYKALKGE